MGEGVKTYDCTDKPTREINLFLKSLAERGPGSEAVLVNPDSRHNLGVGIVTPLNLHIDGHVGYYCMGLCDGVSVKIDGDAGWGLAENLMGGRVELSGSAGSAAGATLRGGKLIIHGNAGARCGIAMKGGAIVVGGDVGYMSCFMMQKGVLVVCGDAGDGLGDSLYEGVIYLRGETKSLGSDAVVKDMTEADTELLGSLLKDAELDYAPRKFKKIASAKRLYNFSTKEKEIWRHAL
jgi:methylamine---glutamate N-methyltransferase subunit B